VTLIFSGFYRPTVSLVVALTHSVPVAPFSALLNIAGCSDVKAGLLMDFYVRNVVFTCAAKVCTLPVRFFFLGHSLCKENHACWKPRPDFITFSVEIWPFSFFFSFSTFLLPFLSRCFSFEKVHEDFQGSCFRIIDFNLGESDSLLFQNPRPVVFLIWLPPFSHQPGVVPQHICKWVFFSLLFDRVS